MAPLPALAEPLPLESPLAEPPAWLAPGPQGSLLASQAGKPPVPPLPAA